MILHEIEREKAMQITGLSSSFVAQALDRAAIVAVTDTKGNILHCNDKFCEISGYSREELIGSNHRILNSSTHDKYFFKSMYKTIAQGNIWTGCIRNRRKNGGFYWVDTTIVPQIDDNGKPSAYLAIRFEVTSHKQALVDLELAREKAEEAAKTKGRFLATMSHELRTPLTGVVGLTELLATTSLDMRQREYVDSLLDAANGLQSVVNDVLYFTKSEADIPVKIAPMNPGELALATVKLLGTLADKKRIALTLSCAHNLPDFVMADAERLRQVLTNLIGNSLKFTEAGEVAVKVSWDSSSQGEFLRFEVKDTGPGFPHELRERLFKPFEQGDNTTSRAHEGAGLGLAISANLVKAMGGKINAESHNSDGATFWFDIPSRVATSSTSNLRPPTKPLQAASLDVLVAEDNPALQRLVQAVLESAGHTCTIAENGAVAVELMRTQPFDICLMDIRMPVMDGLAAIRTIQTQPPTSWPTPPIIALSADILDGEPSRYEELGFQAFLTKPIHTAVLLNTILEVATSVSTSHYSAQVDNIIKMKTTS